MFDPTFKLFANIVQTRFGQVQTFGSHATGLQGQFRPYANPYILMILKYFAKPSGCMSHFSMLITPPMLLPAKLGGHILGLSRFAPGLPGLQTLPPDEMEGMDLLCQNLISKA